MLPEGVIKTKEGWHVLRDDTHLSRWIEIHQRLDVAAPEIELHFAKYIPKGGTVVDAGASLGDHTATYSKLVGPTGSVLAFEPNPLSYYCLQANMAAAKNTHCINRGLSDVTRRDVPLVVEANVGASYIDIAGTTNERPTRSVDCLTLDSFISDLDRLDFFHLDAEGHELKALLGAQVVISRFRPVVAMEMNQKHMQRSGSSEAAVRAFFEILGYSIQETEAHHGPHVEQRDIICLPR